MLRWVSIAALISCLGAASGGNTVEPSRGVVKELALIRRRQVRHRRLEAREDRIEGADQAIDRKVAGEAAAVGAEDADGVADHRRVGGEAPGLAPDAEAGDLEGDVGLASGNLERRTPGAQSLDRAVDRERGVVDDDGDPGE